MPLDDVISASHCLLCAQTSEMLPLVFLDNPSVYSPFDLVFQNFLLISPPLLGFIALVRYSLGDENSWRRREEKTEDDE